MNALNECKIKCITGVLDCSAHKKRSWSDVACGPQLAGLSVTALPLLSASYVASLRQTTGTDEPAAENQIFTGGGVVREQAGVRLVMDMGPKFVCLSDTNMSSLLSLCVMDGLLYHFFK